MKKIILLTFVSMLLSTALVTSIKPVVAEGTIYIRSDGSVDPPTAPIQREGDVYTFTDNIYDSIVVERGNIIVDGNGYTLKGPGTGIGFTLGGNGITIKNTAIKGFDAPGAGFAAAIYSFDTSDNFITSNTIIDNKWGINLEWVTGYSISGNTIANHKQAAIYMTDSENNVISNNLIKNNERAITLGGYHNKIYHNDFIDNTSPGFVLGENNNVWDDGYPSGGNYWSDYTGVDADGDGIGDTAYAVGGIIDRYPLMNPTSGLEIPTEEEIPFWMQWWFWSIVAAGIVVLAGAVYFLKKRKPPTPSGPPPPTEGTA